jgi:hypothetical protein
MAAVAVTLQPGLQRPKLAHMVNLHKAFRFVVAARDARQAQCCHALPPLSCFSDGSCQFTLRTRQLSLRSQYALQTDSVSQLSRQFWMESQFKSEDVTAARASSGME